MHERILFPTDGSDGASAVFEHVIDIAAQQDATVHVLNVADTTRASVTRVGGDVVDALKREGEGIVAETADQASGRGVQTVTDVRQGGIAGIITAYAEEYGVDLIAMPTHGRTGLGQAFLGSVTERVMRRSDTPVLVLRPDREQNVPYRNIVVPTDGSDCSSAALDAAVAVAKTVGATLHVLTVLDVSQLGITIGSKSQRDTLEQRADRVAEEAAETAREAAVDSVQTHVALGDSVSGGIESYITDHDIDLVVMGTHGRTGVGRYLLGSVTERTVRGVSTPVMSVPEPGSGTSIS